MLQKQYSIVLECGYEKDHFLLSAQGRQFWEEATLAYLSNEKMPGSAWRLVRKIFQEKDQGQQSSWPWEW